MICAGILAAACIWYRYCVSHDRPVPKEAIRLIVIASCIGIGVCIYEYMAAGHFDGVITRPGSGQGDQEESLIAEYQGLDTAVDITVSERKLSSAEQKELLKQATKEIDATFAGENDSLDAVTADLNPEETYQDGLVTAEWTFDNDALIDPDGTILWENVTQDSVVEAQASLSCQDQTVTYTFPFRICMPDPASAKGMLLALHKAVEEAQRKEEDRASFTLPATVAGRQIRWKRAYTWKGEQIALLGIAGAIGMIAAASVQKRKRQEAYRRAVDMDYPSIVSELSMYIGAGVPARSALLRMQATYLKRKETSGRIRVGYEQICVTCRQIKEGVPEAEAYSRMGERCNTVHYRKLALLLSQNLRQGNARLAQLLTQEETGAEEMQRLMVRAAGEEASTKLLLPMSGLFAVVMVILILPALLSMQG